MRPHDIFNILYSENIFGRSIFHAVLLQELLLNITVFMNTSPVCPTKIEKILFEYKLISLATF